MRVRLLQIIDYWVGVPLCLLLSIVNLIINPFRSKPTTPKSILFLELSEMGSAIIAYSSFVRVKKLFPDAQLYFLVFKKNQESVALLDTIPQENIILIEEKNFIIFTLSVIGALLRVYQYKIDTTVDLELFSRFTAIFSFLTAARNRVGFNNYTAEGLYRGNLLTHKVFYNPHQHMALNFLALVESLASDPSDVPMLKQNFSDKVVPLPQHAPSQHEVAAIWQLMKGSNNRITPGSSIIVVNPDPGDALPIRGWPLEKFVDAIKQLMAFNPHCFVALIGLERSRAFAKPLLDSIPAHRCVDLIGKTKRLREVVTLFTQAEVLITNDSGPAHFAALTSIGTVTLFGPETPALYGPLTQKASNLYSHYSCSPCLSAANHRHTVCTDNKCLQAIAASEVVVAAQAYMNQSESRVSAKVLKLG